MTPNLEIEPRAHWWEASALTTAPPLLSLNNWEMIAETRGYISLSLSSTSALLKLSVNEERPQNWTASIL